MTKNTELAISEALGIEPRKEIVAPSKNEVVAVEETDVDEDGDIEDDFKLVRKTLRKLIGKVELKLDELGSIATESEKARDFEVYSGIANSIAGISKDLLELHKRKNAETGGDGKKPSVPAGGTYIDKAVFTGTAAQLLHKLKPKEPEDE